MRHLLPTRFVFLSVVALAALPVAFGVATTGCSSADENTGGNPDTDAIAWVSPTSTDEIVVGDLVQLTAMVNDPKVSGVEFAVDGKVLDKCDTSGGPRECRRDGMFRIVTTFAQAGSRRLVARTMGTNTEQTATLDITVLTTRSSSPSSGDAGGGPGPGPGDAGAGSDAGVLVDAGSDAGTTTPPPVSDRGFLDPDRPLHNVFGGVSWAVKDQRVEVVDALTTAVNQIASCMNTYGASVIKHADAAKISRASVIATAITESNCTNPAGSSDGLSSGPMQVTGYTCRALYPGRFGSDAACTSEMHAKPDFSFEAGCKVMGEPYAVNIHGHDPPKIAAQYNAGSVKQSNGNRWHMLVTGNHIDRYVAAYNAYRAWESMNGVARAKLAIEVSKRPEPFFAGEHVATVEQLPVSAAEGQVYFVGNFTARDGVFVTFRDGRWQEH